jgi:hypothetical protein
MSAVRWRGFTPLTVLIAAFDLAVALWIGVLWQWASAERPSDEQPWWGGVMVGLTLLSLAVWAISLGRLREALVAGTVIAVVSGALVLLGMA